MHWGWVLYELGDYVHHEVFKDDHLKETLNILKETHGVVEQVEEVDGAMGILNERGLQGTPRS